MEAYTFLDNETVPDTINPLLYRQAQLNTINGLYNITEDIYQVRGYDGTTMTLVKGDTGWIIVDPRTSFETTRAAMILVKETVGDYPVRAVIYSHPHIQAAKGRIIRKEGRIREN
jgi:alkyl sulfatase BDS1-like metallo-beta-lactamase superfamily hydrolase